MERETREAALLGGHIDGFLVHVNHDLSEVNTRVLLIYEIIK